MLGRKSYTKEELDNCRTAIDEQLAGYRSLVKAIASATSAKKVDSALEAFEVLVFNNMTSSSTANSFTDCPWSRGRTGTAQRS